MNFIEDLGITGHLQIAKQYSDARPEEIVFDDPNIVVSGMSVGLSFLFTGSGSVNITDYQIDRFLLGVSGDSAQQVSSTFSLSGALSSVAEYGAGSSKLAISENSQLKNGAVIAAATLKTPFALIPFSDVTRIDETSVRYTLVVDEDACNSIQRDDADASLNEVGLFMKDPTDVAGDAASLLVAYRYFSPITKTSDFTLVFRWTLNF